MENEDKKQTISVEMFKMWIEGIEEMQEEDWTPSPSQWARIRKKIDQLEEAEAFPVATSRPHMPYAAQFPGDMAAPYEAMMHQQQAPNAWGGQQHPSAPPVVGRSPDGQAIYDGAQGIVPSSNASPLR